MVVKKAPQKIKPKLKVGVKKVLKDSDVEDFVSKSPAEIKKKRSPSTESPPTNKKKAVSVKTIRDGFTMPEGDYKLIDKLVRLSGLKGMSRNKSEILRAGLIALDSMNASDFKKALSQVEKIKPGRK